MIVHVEVAGDIYKDQVTAEFSMNVWPKPPHTGPSVVVKNSCRHAATH